jgi:predicted N-acyltransferase
LDLTEFETFDEYLHSFRRTTRRAFERELRRTQEAGIQYRVVERFSGHAESFSRLYESTYSRYGSSHYRHGPEFWQALERHLGPNAKAVIATQEDALIGFTVVLESTRRGEMWTYRIGRVASLLEKDPPYYFGLSFYAPIRRAIEQGFRRIWLGPAGYQTKRLRGARLVPLESYFWFPRAWDRWTLVKYLALFGKVSREQIDNSVDTEHHTTPNRDTNSAKSAQKKD